VAEAAAINHRAVVLEAAAAIEVLALQVLPDHHPVVHPVHHVVVVEEEINADIYYTEIKNHIR